MSVDQYYRNKHKLTKNETLRFQIISWNKFDKEINDDEFDLEYKIYAFGVTDKNKSICVEINEFTPYFYAKIPDHLQKTWNDFKTEQVRLHLRNKLYKFKESLIKVSVIQKKDLDGFTNEENFNFLKIIVKNEKAFTKCKYILCPGKGRPKVVIPNITSRDIDFKLYEANIEPFIRFCHIQNIKLSGWCEIEKYTNEDNSRCQIDVSCKWKNIIPIDVTNPAKIYILSFDIEAYSERGQKAQKNIFPDPELESDIITQIGSTLHIYGTNVKAEYCFTVNSKQDKHVKEQENIVTVVCETEKELLQKWIKFIRKLDPDIITGYNINNFDWDYIYKRCKYLEIEIDLQYLTRLHDYPAKFVTEKLVTNAYGENIFKYMNAPGLLNSDLYTIIKREKKLPSYKLDYVASEYIGDQKDPISPLDLFNMAQGTAEEIAIIIHYCVKDCTLVIDLILKLCIVTNNIAMANVTWVPIEYIESKGQQIKVHSQLAYEARLNDYLVPTIPYKDSSELEDEEKFTGATVQEAEPGAHFEQITGLDFASLYPSIMIANNYSYETIVKGTKYDNIDEVEYKDIIWTEDAGLPQERVEKVRFVQNKKGILPIMLEKLWTERKAIKKEMKNVKAQLKEAKTNEEKAALSMQYDVLDGFQLAMKVSMNSIYGFTGANLGRLPEKRIAAATTAEGRRMIQACKEYVESN
jgi:DNA polymerase delta subunit 1